ncbi:hemagglutinin repeat-containing protein [Pigmentibacter sp. JX0631]|uniref:HNH endonuclease n=1 Tax=Pigmentibacter sp. JX0631 TaxID=2976982 RepID=UPI0024684F60|nr:hemagglutinin repeat-containing protein [Pigmentibacter sp. JX0631]WGL59624.1 hemagglutinin repeat-containing protein [Pigmentibacter sp. JX0631]
MCKKNLKKLKNLNNNNFNKINFGIQCKKCHTSIPLFNLKRIFSSVLVAAYYACHSSIVYAQIEAFQNAPSGHKPIMDAAHNGVPVVHIAPPNNAGVSHNQFENFNVNGNGAILNNSNQDVQTQLAGWIAANPQFGQNSASVIVNEVMSTNPSYLSGAIEVAGKFADVIIANPNGITCDGCGFINTGRASLVVGRPEFSHDGLVDSFQNLNGQLIIGGKGLNVTNILQLDLIAKSMTVSGEVWANKLNAVLSSSKVNYKNLNANKNENSTGRANGFALDIKAMGGMHAKQLFIVATDKGLGVNSQGRLSSLESDLVLNANGDIKLKDIFAKNNLEISGSENIFLTGKVISENSVKLKSERDIENLGVVSSNGILNINSLNLNNKGELIQNSNNSIILEIKNKSENSGIISGKGEIKITAEKIEDKNGKYESLSTINLASKDFKTDGMSLVSQNIEVKSDSIEIIKTNIATSDSVNVISDNLILGNNSKIIAGNKVKIDSSALKSELSEITSNKEININLMSPLVNNNSKIISENVLNINSNGLENNNGYISANSASLNFNGNEVNNQSGKIIVENDIDLNSSYLNNSNGMIVSGKNVKINTNSNNLNNSNGVLKAEGFIDVNAINSEINNTSGKIISNEKITLNSLFINNNYAEINSGNVEINSSLSNSYGIVNSTNSIELKGDLVLNNEGKILAEKNVIIDSNQKNINNNYGNILSNGKISLNSNSIDNNSGFISGYKEIIVASNYISNNEGRILSASGDISITKGELNNNFGIVNARDSIKINSENINNSKGTIVGSNLDIFTNDIDNRNGEILGKNKIDITSKNIDNSYGSINSENILKVNSSNYDVLNNYGKISAKNDLQLLSNNLQNSNGNISSGNKGSIETNKIENINGEIISKINLNIKSTEITNSGQIQSLGNLDVNSADLKNYNGNIIAGNNLNIKSNIVENMKGKINSGDNVTIDAKSMDNTDGQIKARSTTINLLNNGNLINKNGEIFAEEYLKIKAELSSNDGGKIRSNGNMVLDFEGTNFNNAGGTIESGKSMQIFAKEIDNSKGKLKSGTNIDLQITNLLNKEGEINAKENLKLKANSVLNILGKFFAKNQDLNLGENGILNNENGELFSEKNLSIQSSELNNNSGKIIANENVVINSGLTVENKLGIISSNNEINISSNTLENNFGNISANNLFVKTGELNNEEGKILASGNNSVNAGNIENKQGKIHGQVVAVTLTQGSSISNSSGELLAEKSLSLQGGVAANDQGLISAKESSVINTQGEELNNNSGKVQAVGTLTINSADISNKQGEIVSTDKLQIESTAFNNETGKVLSSKEIAIKSKELNNKQGEIVVQNTGTPIAGHIVIQTQGQKINNEEGKILASGNNSVNAGNIENKQGKIHGQAVAVTLVQGSSISNSSGELLAEKSLSLQGGVAANDQGLISAKESAVINTQGEILNNNSGKVQAVGTLTINSADISNKQGEIVSTDKLQIESMAFNNETGKVLSSKEIAIKSKELYNKQGEIVVQNSGAPLAGHIVIQTQGQKINNEEGKILASGNNSVNAGNIENKQGKIHGQEVAVTLVQGSSISNSSGELLAEKSLNLQGGVAANDQGLISAKESAVINTQGEILNNNSGKVQAIGTLTINSADISNKQGEIVSTDKLQIESAAFNNETGKVLSSKEIAIKSKELNNKQGEIVVQNTGAPLAGHIVIQTQGQKINNEEGKILASGNNSVNAGNIENKQGKIHGQAVAVTLTQGSSISNSSGELLAEKSINLQGGVAANDQGLISAKESAVINTQGEKLNNNSGKVQAVGTLTINSADISNKQGEIVSTDKLQIESTAFNNETGKVLSSKEIAIKSKELNNKQGEIVVQNTGAPLAGHIVIQTQGQKINNEEGKILASGNNSVNAGNIENKQGKIHGQAVAVTLTQGSSISNSSGELLAEKSLSLQGGVAANDQGLISAKESAVINTQGEKLNNNSGKVQAVGTLTINSSDISNKQGEIVSTDKMQIESTAFNNETGKVLSSKEIAIKSKELNNKQGEIVVQNTGTPLSGHIAIQTQGQKINNEEGKILASGNNSVNAGNIENKQGKIHGQVVAVTLTQGSSISNRSGELLAEKSLNLQGGVAANDQGLISAKESAVINTQGEKLNNNNGKVQAVGTLTINSSDISNKQGEIVSTDKLQIESTAFNNETGKVLSSKEIAIKSKELNNKQGEIVVQNTGAPLAGHIVIQTQGQKVNNEQGKILASGNNMLEAGNLENKQGKIHGQAVAVTLTQGSSISNSSGELLAEKSLSLQGGVAANDQGLISAKESAVINTQGEKLNNNSGKVQAVGTLTINSSDISNKQGEIVSTDKLQIESTAFSNETGKVLSSKEIAIKSKELNNKQGEIIVQNTGAPLAGHIVIQTQGQKVNNEEGKILASGNNSVNAGNIENKQGKIHGQAVAVTLTQGSSISNSSGELLAEKSLSLQGGVAANDQGLISAKESAVINTQGEKLNNEKGRIQAQQNLAINSAQLINKQGNISTQMNAEINSFDISNIFGHIFSKENLNINSSNIDNTNGKINGQDLNMLLAGSSSISNNDGKIIAEKSFDLKGGLLTNVKGEILANYDLNFNSHGLLINNDQGSIHSNQNIDIQSGLLTNRQGSIQSERNSKFKSSDLINDKGKIFSQEKIDVDSNLISNKEGFIVAKEIEINTNNHKIENQKGTIHSKNDINIQSNDLHNEHGSILAGNRLNLTTASIFNNYGYLAGQSGINSNSQKIDNTSGLILTKKIAASLGMNTNNKEIINKLGTIVSSNDLSIQSGDIKNENGKLFGQSIDIKLVKGTNLSNDNGSIISKSDLNITGGLNSNKFGLIASHGNSNINSDGQTVNNSQGVIQANKQLTLKTENLNNNQGVIASVDQLKINSKILDNDKGKLFTTGSSNINIETNKQKLSNNEGKISASGNLALNASELISNKGVVSAENVDVNLNNGKLENDHGKLIAEEKLNINSGFISNKYGTLGSNNKLDINTNKHNLDNLNGKLQAEIATIQSGNFDNQNGVINVGNKLNVNSELFNNNNGIIVVHSINNNNSNEFILDTNGNEFSNVGGKIFANVLTKILNTSNIKNNNGYLFAKDLTIKIDHLQNNHGIVFTSNHLKIDANELSNQNGRIISSNTLTANISNVIQNQQGQINATGNLNLKTQNFNNSSGQIASLSNLILNANQINNSSGTIHGNGASKIEASSTNNNSGHIYSNGSLVLNSSTLQNENGNIGTTQNLEINSSSNSLGGKIISQGNMNLNISSNYTNTTDLAAGGNLNLSTAGLTNSNKIQANGNLKINTSGDATNNKGATIAAKSAELNVQGKFTNLGKFDGENVKINAASIENKAQISGNNLDIKANEILNHEQGKFVGASANGSINFAGGNLTNEKGGEILSAGNISFSLDKLTNISTKIYASGNINFNSTDVTNKKENYVTEIREIVYNYSPHKNELQFEKGDILGHKRREKITHRKTTYGEEIKEDSAVGEIKAGGNMHFAGNVLNDKSVIISAGTMIFNQASTNNASYIIERQYWENGNFFDVHRYEISFSDSMFGGFQTKHEIRTDDKVLFNITRSDNAMEKHTLTEAIMVGNKAVGTLTQAQNINLSATQNIVPSLSFSSPAQNPGVSLVKLNKESNYQGSIQSSFNPDEQVLQTAATNNQSFVGNKLSLQAVQKENIQTAQLQTYGKVLTDNISFRNGSIENPNIPLFANRNTQFSFSGMTQYNADQGSLLNYSNTSEVIPAELSLTDKENFNFGNISIDNKNNENIEINTFENANNILNSQETEPFSVPLDNGLLKQSNVFQYFDPAAFNQNYALNMFDYFAANKQSIKQNYQLSFTELEKYSLSNLEQKGVNFRKETDSKYTDYNNFYASDYYFNQLKLQPDRQLKKYGDNQNGRLADADDNLGLTGQTFLTNYQATEKQFVQIVNAGKQFTQSYQISPGTNLSAESMKQLTSIIIANVDEKTNKVEKGLRNLANQDLKKHGGFIAFGEMDLKISGDFKNEGTFFNADGKLEAQNIINDGGKIIGNNTQLEAKKDFKNIEGMLLSDKQKGNLFIKAGNKIFMETKAVDIDYTIDGVKQKLTEVGAVASVSGHNISLYSEGNIEKIGTQIDATGKLQQYAKGNIDAKSTVLEKAIHSNTMNGGYLKEKSTTHFIGNEKSGSDNILIAEKDINYKGVDIESKGKLSVSGENVTFKAEVESNHDEYYSSVRNSQIYNSATTEKSVGGKLNANNNILIIATGEKTGEKDANGEAVSKNGTGNVNLTGTEIKSKNANIIINANNDVNVISQVLNNKFASWSVQTSEGAVNSTTTSANSGQNSQGITQSVLSANNILINAGDQNKKQGNINIQSGQLVASKDIQLNAGNEINIISQELKSESHSHSESSTSGLMGTSVSSFTVGQKDEKQKGTSKVTQNIGSTVATKDGNISINAGGKYYQKGSNLLSVNGSVDVEAESIKIEHTKNIYVGAQEREVSVNGLNVGARNEAFSLGQNLYNNYNTSQNTTDPRMQAILAAASGLSVYNTLSPALDKNDPKELAKLKVSTGIGGSSQKNSMSYYNEEINASSINAGNNVSLKARGAGADSKIEIYGSDVKANNKLTLNAEGDIIANAAKAMSKSSSDALSYSWQAGVAFNVSTEGVGVAGEVTGTLGQSGTNKYEVAHRNSHLEGSKQVEIVSGGNTNLIGGTIRGDKVTGDIKGNLYIESLQDLSKFSSDAKSGSLTGTACVPPICAGNSGASFSYTQTDMDSYYQSVGEQSGIFAGSQGFQLKVGGNTHLKGAVISSNDEAIKNKRNTFETGTFSSEDIVNKAWYEASQFTVAGSVGTLNNSVAPTVPLYSSDSKSNTTYSGVSGGSFVIRDDAKQRELTGKSAERTIAETNRDTSNTHEKLAVIFDEQKITTEFQIVTTFNNELNTFINNQANKQDNYKKELEGLLDSGADPNSSEVKEAQSNLESAEKWGPGGSYRQIAQALSLAISGNVGGSNIDLIKGFAANYLQSLGAEKVKELAQHLGGEGSPAHVALHAVLGCVAGSIKGTCEQTAVGAAAGVVVNELLKEDKKLTAEEKEKKLNITTGLIGSLANALGEKNVAAVTSGAQIESENNSLKKLDHISLGVSLVDAARLKMIKMQSDNLKQELEKHIGEYATVGDYVFNSHTFESELLMLSEGKKTFAEFLDAYGKSAVLEIILNKSLSRLTELKPELKSILQPALLNVQKKGEDWLLNEGLSKQEQIKLTEKYEDTYKLLSGKTSLKELERTKGIGYLLEVGSELNKKGIHLDKKGGTDWQLVRIDSKTQKEKALNINLVNGVQEGYQSTSESKNLKDIIEGKTTWEELANKKGKDYVERLVKSKEAEGIWNNELINPNTSINGDKENTILKKWDEGKNYLVENDPKLKDKPSILGNKAPYSSREIAEDMKDRHGKDNVTSTTVPPLNKPNVKMAGKEKVIQLDVQKQEWDVDKKQFKTVTEKQDVKIVFDKKGYPIFDDVMKVEVRIPVKEYREMEYRQQLKAATKELKRLIQENIIPKTSFTAKQLEQINKELPNFDGYTWHHHQETGRMQSVPRNIHEKVSHIGWEGMQGETKNEK